MSALNVDIFSCNIILSAETRRKKLQTTKSGPIDCVWQRSISLVRNDFCHPAAAAAADDDDDEWCGDAAAAWCKSHGKSINSSVRQCCSLHQRLSCGTAIFHSQSLSILISTTITLSQISQRLNYREGAGGWPPTSFLTPTHCQIVHLGSKGAISGRFQK